jgi:3',5'-nucleoside bisphosphate phosphatase
MIDLHTHSTRSDGACTPTELIERAAAAGVTALALTDHDSVDGLGEAAQAADRVGLRLIPGVEVSAAWRAQTIHVLGLWVDPQARSLRAALAGQADRRRRRLHAICAQLSLRGLPGERVRERIEARTDLPTRTHIAAELVAGGHAKHAQDAFRLYLGRGRAAKAAADWPPLAEIVGWIVAAGGTASLAHPTRYGLSAGARRQLLADFAAAGGRSLEVVTGGNAAHHVQTCAMLAARFGLQGSVGSDFHGPQLPWNPLGRLAKLPDGVIPAWRSRGLEGLIGG